MSNLIRSLAVDVLEYGKFFSLKDSRTSDFLVLAFTRNVQGQRKQYQDILSFPLQTSFMHQKVGTVSAALLPASPTDHVFVQVQRRIENEIIPEDFRGRQYRQERYTLIPNNDLKELLSESVSIYHPLIFQHLRNYSPGYPELKNYINHIDGQIDKPVISFYGDDDQAFLEKWGPQIKVVTEKVLRSETRGRHVRVICPGWELADKARLMEIVQRLVFPLVGVISFALDYVSEPYHPLRVLFLNDPVEEIAHRDALEVVDFRKLDHKEAQDSYAYAVLHLRKKYSWKDSYHLVADKYVAMALQNIFADRVKTNYAAIFDSVDAILEDDAHKIVIYCRIKELIVSHPSFSKAEFYSDINDLYALLDDEHKKMVMRAVHQCVLEARYPHTDFYTQVCDQTLTPIDKLIKIDFNMFVRGVQEKWDGNMPPELCNIFVKNGSFFLELLKIGREKQAILDTWPDEKVHRFFLKLFSELLLLSLDQFKLVDTMVGWFFEFEFFANTIINDGVWCVSFEKYFPNLVRYESLWPSERFGLILRHDVVRVESLIHLASERDERRACILRARVKCKWPIPVRDLAFLIDRVVKHNKDADILDEIPAIESQSYDDLSPAHWLRWVRAITDNHPEPDAVWWAFYNRAKIAHPIFARKTPASLPRAMIPFVEEMLCWVPVFPNADKQLGEYELWLHLLERCEASEIPEHLRFMFGEQVEGMSFWKAVNLLCPLHRERLFDLAIEFVAKHEYKELITASDVLRLVK